MQIKELYVEKPENVTFMAEASLKNDFFQPLYHYLYNLLDPKTHEYPHIDFDIVEPFISGLLENLSKEQINNLKRIGYGKKTVTNAEWQRSPSNRALMIFLNIHPVFADLLKNITLLADIAIESLELHIGAKINTENFVHAKQLFDKLNRVKWNRRQNSSESQSGVSNLGSVSELLLAKALFSLIDNVNFFRTTNPKVKTYGDFVLICLPNNLWISVKSNFARERLLASGYSTDIIGVGFFSDSKEFTSKSKIRNFQRVGFLAMYLPEIPISEKQVATNTNTYDTVVNYYASQGFDIPKNINGTDFLRPLSRLHQDLSGMINMKVLANRTTLDF